MKPRTIVFFAIGPICGALISALTIPAMAWLFAPSDVGRFTLLQTSIGFLVAFTFLGLDQAYVREFHESGNKGSLLRATFFPGLLLYVPLAGVVAVFGGPLSKLIFGENEPLYMWLMLACALFAYLSRQMSLILRMREAALAFSMSQLLPKAALLLFIVAIGATALPESFLALELSLLVASVLVSLFYAVATMREWAPAFTTWIVRRPLRPLLKFALPLMLATLTYWALAASSVYALRAFSTFDEIGIYAVSASVAGIAGVVQSIFSIVWAPIVYRWSAERVDMDAVGMVARQVVVIVAFVFVLCGSLSWILSFLLPAAYEGVEYLVLASIVQPLLYTLAEVTGVGINLTRRTAGAFWSTIAALAVAVLLNGLLVPMHGAAGAVAANALAFVSFFVLRTELSAALWRPFPRSKMYLVVGICVSVAVLEALFGREVGPWVSSLWLAVGGTVAIVLRRDIAELAGTIRERRK